MPKMTRSRDLGGNLWYEIDLPVRFLIHRRGRGWSVNLGTSVKISRSEMVFRSRMKLRAGDTISAAVDLPMPAPDNGPMLLVLNGHIVRVRSSMATMGIARHRLTPASMLVDYQHCSTMLSAVRREPYNALIPPLVLVHGSEELTNQVWAVLGPAYVLIQAVAGQEVQEFIACGFPPICLLITNTLLPLTGLSTAVPVLYIQDKYSPEEDDSLQLLFRQIGPEWFVTITNTLTYEKIRNGIAILWERAGAKQSRSDLPMPGTPGSQKDSGKPEGTAQKTGAFYLHS